MKEVWFQNKAEAENVAILRMIAARSGFSKEEYQAIIDGRFEIVPNTKDSRGGFLVLVGAKGAASPAKGSQPRSSAASMFVVAVAMGVLMALVFGNVAVILLVMLLGAAQNLQIAMPAWLVTLTSWLVESFVLSENRTFVGTVVLPIALSAVGLGVWAVVASLVGSAEPRQSGK